VGADDNTARGQGHQDRGDDTVGEGPRWRGRRAGLRSQGGGGREGAGGVGLGSLSALEARGARATSASSTTVAVAAGLTFDDPTAHRHGPAGVDSAVCRLDASPHKRWRRRLPVSADGLIRGGGGGGGGRGRRGTPSGWGGGRPGRGVGARGGGGCGGGGGVRGRHARTCGAYSDDARVRRLTRHSPGAGALPRGGGEGHGPAAAPRCARTARCALGASLHSRRLAALAAPRCARTRLAP